MRSTLNIQIKPQLNKTGRIVPVACPVSSAIFYKTQILQSKQTAHWVRFILKQFVWQNFLASMLDLQAYNKRKNYQTNDGKEQALV